MYSLRGNWETISPRWSKHLLMHPLLSTLRHFFRFGTPVARALGLKLRVSSSTLRKLEGWQRVGHKRVQVEHALFNLKKPLKIPCFLLIKVFLFRFFSCNFHGTTSMKNAQKIPEKCLKKTLDLKSGYFKRLSNPPFGAPSLSHSWKKTVKSNATLKGRHANPDTLAFLASGSRIPLYTNV